MLKSHGLACTISLAILFGFNILMISSLSPKLLPKQLLAWAIGFGLFFIGKQIDPKNLRGSKATIFIVTCLLLLIPIITSSFIRGSRRWIDIGPVSIQPSELSKPWLLIALANSLNPFLIWLPAAIVLLQPDLGSALSILVLSAPAFLYHPRIYRYLIVAIITCALISPVVWRFGLHDYQRHRILTFINPDSDPLGKGYNVIQSKIAIGSGGFWGKGYRKGSQGQLLFLPEKHTDFMFAATVEERGILGALIILGCYFTLVFSLFSKAFQTTNNRPLFLFTLGLAFQIWFLSFVNIGMNLGILPVTGIPLPFLSVGGSSVMGLLFALGIVHSS